MADVIRGSAEEGISYVGPFSPHQTHMAMTISKLDRCKNWGGGAQRSVSLSSFGYTKGRISSFGHTLSSFGRTKGRISRCNCLSKLSSTFCNCAPALSSQEQFTLLYNCIMGGGIHHCQGERWEIN